MTYEIHDPRKWRLSKSGFSIKTGWANETKIIAKYPGSVAPLNPEQFTEWTDNAERICDLYNAMLGADTSDIDQLRAQVAALEAEVARLREPLALVWANHNDEKKSQEIDGHWYEVRISLWGGFYPVFCDALSTQTVNRVLNAEAESLAIAACEAHHAARFREMQGK